MALVLAWSLFALGVAHLLLGLSRFRTSLAAAVSEGFIGRFSAAPERRTAFWFLIFAVPLMLVGQIAVHAVTAGELWVLELTGYYLLPASLVGVLAFPKSPLWAPLLLAPLLIAAGLGLL